MTKALAVAVLACLLVVQARAEAAWLTDLSQAQTQAKTQNKKVLLDFTGSDWCPPCKALEKTVLSSAAFAGYASTNLVLVRVDFPRHKELSATQQKANDELAQKFSVDAFPTVVVLDSQGKELKRTRGYGGESTSEFLAELGLAK